MPRHFSRTNLRVRFRRNQFTLLLFFLRRRRVASFFLAALHHHNKHYEDLSYYLSVAAFRSLGVFASYSHGPPRKCRSKCHYVKMDHDARRTQTRGVFHVDRHSLGVVTLQLPSCCSRSASLTTMFVCHCICILD